MKTVKDYIRTIVDFPHEGIMFRDVTTLFADPRGFRMCIDQMLHPYAGQPIDKVVGLEARGFILGGAIAHQLGTGFVPVRKKGKLPGTTISQDYKLEYGEAIVEIHDEGTRLVPGDDVDQSQVEVVDERPEHVRRPGRVVPRQRELQLGANRPKRGLALARAGAAAGVE